MDANLSRAVQILIDERTNVQRPQINLSRIAEEIDSLVQEEIAEDGTYESSAIEIDIADLECWRDSILAVLEDQ
jgi:hypothetical protein